ncbi:MAG: FIST C-terminal domain-containing protein [Dechloromonas sp.]|nr:FIST C-terminal domain-containing protein [Dechloromonas sp.]
MDACLLALIYWDVRSLPLSRYLQRTPPPPSYGLVLKSWRCRPDRHSAKDRTLEIRQLHLSDPTRVNSGLADAGSIEPHLVLVFGDVRFFEHAGFADALAARFPAAVRVGCSTAGEITGKGVSDGSCVITLMRFDRAQVRVASTVLASMDDSLSAGERLAQQLTGSGLKTGIVLAPGVGINGSALVKGLTNVLGTEIPLAGGLAGDGGAFRRTLTLTPDGVSGDAVVAVGFYGDNLVFGHGSFGGWEPFGPSRRVTGCTGNVLHELDGEPALSVYRSYLGEYAKDLPASGLLFPFAMVDKERRSLGLIRTILGIDEKTGSLILAGDIQPEGYLQLMHANTDRLVDGAEKAAELATQRSGATPGLTILVSCVGRKIVMGERVDEEIEAVAAVLGKGETVTGFYSYGEISPFTPEVACELHNQTMTVFRFAES